MNSKNLPGQGPAVAVAIAAMTITPDQKLSVVLRESAAGLTLPRAAVPRGIPLEQAARLALGEVLTDSPVVAEVNAPVVAPMSRKTPESSEARAQTGQFQQLQVFEGPEENWALTISYLATFQSDVLELTEQFRLMPVESESVQKIGQPDADIVEYAVGFLRREYQLRPDPYWFLKAEEVTLFDLRAVHQIVANRVILKDSFRRRMIPRLVATGEVTQGRLGKPARTYTRKPLS